MRIKEIIFEKGENILASPPTPLQKRGEAVSK
jgi:hypothetical protein